MKLNKSQLSIGILFLSLSVVGILFAFSKLTPSASPSSTYHSLNDIYTLITSGTEKATPNSALTTSSSPSATTSHSTTEIYLLLANKFRPEDLRPRNTVFGISGSYGTPDPSYVVATGTSISSLVPTGVSGVPDGYTLEDIYNLVYGNTRITTPNHTFSSSPSASMYTTTEIYNALKEVKTILTANKFGTTTSIFGLTGTFAPTAQIGEGCSDNNDCYSASCDAWNTGICTTGEIGQGCYNGEGCTSGYCDTWAYLQCTDGSIGSYCGSGNDCALGYCDPSNTGQCTDGQIGSNCTDGSSCESGYCDDWNTYTCTDGGLGAGCYSNSSCASGMCAFDDSTYTSYGCSDGLTGSACSNNTQCGEPNICDTGTHTCVDGSNGASCTSSLGCSSGYCDSINSICTDGSLGTACGAGSECSTGYCDSINSICSSGVPGSVCGGDSECDTYNCVSNVCSADLPPLTSMLVGYWKLDETSGTVAVDSSGAGHSGTISPVNVTINQSGKVGQSYKFNNTWGAVNFGDVNNWNSDARTFSFWYKTGSSLLSTSNSIMSKAKSGVHLGFVIQITETTGKIQLVKWGASVNSAAIEGVSSFSPNTWYHIAIVAQGTNKGIYVNGISLATSWTGSINDFSAFDSSDTYAFVFGRQPDHPQMYLVGIVDEIAIWNRPLAPAEITTLYNGGAGVAITP